jgi:hypothetical protein
MHHFGNWLQMNSIGMVYLNPSIKNIKMQSKHFKGGCISTHQCMWKIYKLKVM